jgi:DNA invertase Pin-like site-specific DNA recombinase
MARKRKNADPKRAVAYVRVSTDRQDLSPDAQREAIERWAKRKRIEVVAVHEDVGVSGGVELDKRPGLLAAIDALPAQDAGVLLVARRDRLARDVLVAAMVERLCERHGARVQSADGTGNGEGPEAALLRGIVDVFAAYERAVIRSRTRAALAVKKARGERVGTIPYGYRLAPDGKHVEEDPHEAAVVRRTRELRADGESLRAIGRTLLAEGHTPRSGKGWHVQVLARMVDSVAHI